ncbi:hypothetical protein [Kocuria arenosa]
MTQEEQARRTALPVDSEEAMNASILDAVHDRLHRPVLTGRTTP